MYIRYLYAGKPCTYLYSQYSVRNQFLYHQIKHATVPQRMTVNVIQQIQEMCGFVRALNGFHMSKMKNNACISNAIYTIIQRLSVSLGSSKQLSGKSCKHIRDVITNGCPLPSKLYWVQEIEVYILKYN